MRRFVYPTQGEAVAAVETINARARAVFAAQGYTVRPTGEVVGKAAGHDDPQGVTTTWDVPRQRLDGKWTIVHPEAHPSASFVVSPGVSLVDFLVAGLPGSIEDEAEGWWPVLPVEA